MNLEELWILFLVVVWNGTKGAHRTPENVVKNFLFQINSPYFRSLFLIMRHVQGPKTIVNYTGKDPLSINLSFFGPDICCLDRWVKITFNRYYVIHFNSGNKKEKKWTFFLDVYL